MKNNKIIASVLIIFLLISVFLGYSKFKGNGFFSPPPVSQYILDEQANIVAVWTSEGDPSYRLDFRSDGTCYEYYESTLIATHSYSISNTTPQCGIAVLIDPSEETSYLQLVNNADGTGECYEINGVGDLLSLTTVGTAEIQVFYK